MVASSKRWKVASDPLKVWKELGEGQAFLHSTVGRCVSLCLWERPGKHPIFWYITVPDLRLRMFSSDYDKFRYKRAEG